MFQFARDAYISTAHLHHPRFSTQVVAQSHLRNRIRHSKFQTKYKKEKKRNKIEANKEYIGKELIKAKRN
jgi:hypothetical protein